MQVTAAGENAHLAPGDAPGAGPIELVETGRAARRFEVEGALQERGHEGEARRPRRLGLAEEAVPVAVEVSKEPVEVVLPGCREGLAVEGHLQLDDEGPAVGKQEHALP